MVTRTVVGFFESRSKAEAVADDLRRAGFGEQDISLSSEPARPQEEQPSFWDQVKDALGFEDVAYYEEGARRGGTVIAVDTSEDRVDTAVDVIERHNPDDIDVHAERWQQEGWQPPQREARREEETRIPLPEEELRVGKRRVQRGGARIYTRVTEKPVEEQVDLTDEHVDVERRATDRPAGEDAFRERTVEMDETHEEPVVEKEARVREEMVMRKEKEEHTETVRDTVRKTEADVDRGEEEEDRPAYEFGRELAHDDRFRGRSWESIEPEARQAFERRRLGDWSRHRNAVHDAYERARRS